MTKQQLAELVLTKEQLQQIDYTLPQDWVDMMAAYNIEVRNTFVWSYISNEIIGSPMDLAKLYLEKFDKAPELIKACNELLYESIAREDCWEFDLQTPDQQTDDNMLPEYKKIVKLIKHMED